MRHLKILSIIIVFLGILGNVYAQNTPLEEASAYYRAFLMQTKSGTNSEDMYYNLQNAYSRYCSVINAGANYNIDEIRSAFKTMWPFMKSGAVYYSKKRQQNRALFFAKAYIDIPSMDISKSDGYITDSYYPTLVYFAASGCYNSNDYRSAIRYFKEYINTGDTENKRRVYAFMIKAHTLLKEFDAAQKVSNEALTQYPNDFNILSMAINACIDSGDDTYLQGYVTKALAIEPNNQVLLNIQGKIYEKSSNYNEAIRVYEKLRSMMPNSLNVAKHLSLNYFNIGILYYNQSQNAASKDLAYNYKMHSETYLTKAKPLINNIIVAEPTSVQFLQALASIYKCEGDDARFNQTNSMIASLGGEIQSKSDLPPIMSLDQPSKSKSQSQFENSTPSYASNTSSVNEELFSDYAKKYIESRIISWQEKDPYETIDEYKKRVTNETRNSKVKELMAEAEKSFLDNRRTRVDIDDFELKPYDAENEVFLAVCEYGEVIIPVPRANGEAKMFGSSWEGVQIRNPKFHIDNDNIRISELTFVSPMGKEYKYESNKSFNYTETNINMAFEDINYDKLANSNHNVAHHSSISKTKVNYGASDVDVDIPKTKGVDNKTFAVIIANENYGMVAKVPNALNDGKVFAKYCNLTLGLPETNIRLYTDASYGSMLSAVNDIKSISDAYTGDINVIFYYAGHGIPNEATKDAYLMPIDGDGKHTEACYSLNKLYNELGGLNAKSVLVFLDACFSGAQRGGEMLASARGVALKAKKEEAKGNMVIFSAASNDETAFPYEEKQHGLFTYYILKKLQSTKGNVSLKELSDYVIQNVKQQSVVINRKSQTPTITPSLSMHDIWEKIEIKR